MTFDLHLENGQNFKKYGLGGQGREESFPFEIKQLSLGMEVYLGNG